MIFRYRAPSGHGAGGFSFHLNEATVNTLKRARTYNRLGKRRSTVVTMHVTGKLLEVYGSSGWMSSQSEVTTAIDGLETDFLDDLRDGTVAGLYLDDGTTPTSHILTSADAMDGVKVLQIQYGKAGGAEYTNLRSFDIVLQAEYQQDGLGGNIQYFRETIRTVGFGGPKTVYVPTFDGGVQGFVIWDATPQHIYQQGEVYALTASPITYVPAPIYPDENDERQIANIGPLDRVGGQYDWGSRWSYHMVRTGGGVVFSLASLSPGTGAVANQAPVASNEVNTVTMDVLLEVGAGSGVLANATDADGDTMFIDSFSIAGEAGPFNLGSPYLIVGIGTFTLNSDGSYSFDPATSYTGAVPVVTFTVSDGKGGTDTATLTLTVS